MELVIENLSKVYPNGTRALDDVSLRISTGMYGLLGPNGAGKSTLMRTIATLQEPTSGRVLLGDIDVREQPDLIRRQLGYLPQEFGVYPSTSAQDLLDHLAILKGITDRGRRRELVDTLLERVNLADHRKKAVAGFSGGMRQRFGIAQALIGDPTLVIVDEPTAGLDPGERNRFYNLLSEIGENKIVILSTHIVQDVEQLCSQMAIINNGRLLYAGTPADAKTPLSGKIFEKRIPKAEAARYDAEYRVVSSRLVAGQPQIHVYSETDPGEGFQRVEPDLEDVFFTEIFGFAETVS